MLEHTLHTVILKDIHVHVHVKTSNINSTLVSVKVRKKFNFTSSSSPLDIYTRPFDFHCTYEDLEFLDTCMNLQ